MPYPTTVDANVVAPWLLETGEAASGAAAALVANTTYLAAIKVDTPITITGMRYRCGTASGNMDMGIYDVNGNLLGHTGVTATVAGVNLVSLTSQLSLNAGRYYLAFWIDNATATIIRINSTNENMSNALVSSSTNTGGLASSFSGMGGVTSPSSNKVILSAVVQGGMS